MEHSFDMHLVKETKGALRYEGVGDDNPQSALYLVGTLYLRKAGVQTRLIEDGADWPKAITVTVVTDDE